MGAGNGTDPQATLARIPRGAFIMTSAYDDRRSGVLVRWVQQCSLVPPMVMVAVGKGQSIEPLIRDSRCFALCQISQDDRVLQRRFTQVRDVTEDPFITFSTRVAPTGSPIVDQAISYIDCDLARHVELDADHRIYVGAVRAAATLRHDPPAVFYGPNGR